MTSTQAWVSCLSSVELPLLANTLKRINELTDSDSSTVSRAITLIGFDSVKSMAISSLIVDSLLKRSSRPHLLKCLARHAVTMAELTEDGWRTPEMDRMMETLGSELDESPPLSATGSD